MTALDALVCLDGSARAADALAPAITLAATRGEQVSVVVLEPETGQARHRLAEQLARAGVEDHAVTTVDTKVDLVRELVQAAAQGRTPVLSAFGRWPSSGRLTGVLGELVRADVSRVIAIGPNVTMANATTDRAACVLVAADGVQTIETLLAATEDFVEAGTNRILLAQVVPPTEPGISYSTRRDAHKFKEHFDVRIETAAITGTDVGSALASLARREHASLIVAQSWHRWHARQPATASNSLSITAEAPCPVLIVT